MDMKNLNWIELDRQAILKNLKSLQKLSGDKVKLYPALKANGYGHGLEPMVEILARSETPGITLHSTVEAEISRKAGWDKKILLVGPVAPDDIDSIVRLDLEPTIFELSFLEQLGKYSQKNNIEIKLHLKLETGTHRQGLLSSELNKAASTIKKYRFLKVAGLSTHFANIEDTINHRYAKGQLAEFKKQSAALKKLGISYESRHTACSAALLLFKETYFDIARPGISLYGYWPSRETYLSYRLGGGENSILNPALSLYSRITQIKSVPADSFIGYGCTYRSSARLKIAVLPIGYSDGIDRGLSNLGYVLIRGRRAPIRGRICMNLMMVDVTDIKGVKLWDQATIIGGDKKEHITADHIAGWCQTINYEILSRLSQNIPRLVV